MPSQSVSSDCRSPGPALRGETNRRPVSTAAQFDCDGGEAKDCTQWAKAVTPAILLLPAVLICLAGCRLTEPQAITRPDRYSIRAEKLVVLSDFKLDRKHPVIADLQVLRENVADTLQLPPQEDPVVVYIFDTELSYRAYLDATWPGLPPRRAYFVGTPGELAVYTFWGDRIQEDLRHEYTHGLLHASLQSVPLWIDEGLAEYFEVTGPDAGAAVDGYARDLVEALGNGWRPDLDRLESLSEFSQMQRLDYQEAWAWVHYMLHHTPETREVLLTWLHQLRTTSEPDSLNGRLREIQAGSDVRLISYLTAMRTPGLEPVEAVGGAITGTERVTGQ